MRKSLSQAMNRMGRLTCSERSTGSRYDGWFAATTAGKAASTRTAVKKSPATKVATKAPASSKKAPVKKMAPKKTADKLAVKADEKPWTAKELGEVRNDLNAERDRLRNELNMAEVELADLMRDAGDGAGNDQADVGSTTFERDHEMSLANNARALRKLRLEPPKRP